MPYCKHLEVVLLPDKIRESEIERPNCTLHYNEINYNIQIKHSEIEIITIKAEKKSECQALWQVFALVHILQALGIGYFYTIHELKFSHPVDSTQNELTAFAKECMENLLYIYTSASDWKGDSLFLISSEKLINTKTLDRFLHLYQEDGLRLIHNGALIQCAYGMYPEMRCAGIIQLFENFSWYIKDPNRKRSHQKDWNLYKGLEYAFDEFPIEYFERNIRWSDNFICKLVNTRNRMMHYDVWKDKNSCFSEGRDNAGYARILMIYYRHIILKLLGYGVEEKAGFQIMRLHNWLKER